MWVLIVWNCIKPKYERAVDLLLGAVPFERLKAYLQWCMIEAAAPRLSSVSL